LNWCAAADTHLQKGAGALSSTESVEYIVMAAKKFVVPVALFAALTSVAVADAQVFTPTYTSPRLVNEMGVNVSQYPADLALEGLWRGGPIGLRVGYANASGGLLTLGGEIRSPLDLGNAPMGLAFTAGAQGLIGDESAVGMQAGVSAGYTFMGTGVAFTPYLHPRVGLINDRGMSDFELRALADVGVDAEFYNNLLVRLGVNLGDVGAGWGVGIGWRR
jgi:hypothetical protein